MWVNWWWLKKMLSCALIQECLPWCPVSLPWCTACLLLCMGCHQGEKSLTLSFSHSTNHAWIKILWLMLSLRKSCAALYPLGESFLWSTWHWLLSGWKASVLWILSSGWQHWTALSYFYRWVYSAPWCPSSGCRCGRRQHCRWHLPLCSWRAPAE